jgi:hypothetical protein
MDEKQEKKEPDERILAALIEAEQEAKKDSTRYDHQGVFANVRRIIDRKLR